MYELPEEPDLSFLVGCEFEQVCLGQFQTQLRFSRDVVVAIQADFSLDGKRQPVSEGHVRHQLLGDAVKAVHRATAVDLGITSTDTNSSCTV
jgi:hypothetical protein